MKFTLLIRAAPGARPDPGTPEFDAESVAYRAFTQEVIDAGVFVTGDRLEPAPAGVVVRVRDERTSIEPADGGSAPEDLGGYYVLDCESIEVAASWAARIPTTAFGSVEVRPSRVLH